MSELRFFQDVSEWRPILRQTHDGEMPDRFKNLWFRSDMTVRMRESKIMTQIVIKTENRHGPTQRAIFSFEHSSGQSLGVVYFHIHGIGRRGLAAKLVGRSRRNESGFNLLELMEFMSARAVQIVIGIETEPRELAALPRKLRK